MTNLLESISSNVKTIFDLAKLINNKDLLAETGELQMQLSNLKTAYAALQDENRELKEKIRSLEKGNEEPPVYKNGAYYSQSGNGPFCTACYDKDKKQIRLSKLKISTGLVNHICPVCKAPYNLSKLI
jgi:FtsZ-binding cell division protein ZapB